VTVTSPSPVLAASGATRGPCDRSTADPSRAAGAIGTVGVSQLGSSASITVHATLFFADATGTITAVRMDADDLSFAAIACPPP
jgi:hypothetical protein